MAWPRMDARRRRRGATIAAAAWLLVGALAAGCGGRDQPEDDAAAADPSFLPARAEFRMQCAACHGKRGRGSAGLFPPLRGSDWANADPGIPVRVVLHGLDGPLTVGGVEYLNRMAPLGDRLTDEQIATILTYVRASWGNRGTVVTADQVAAVRRETAGKQKPWTELELRNLMGNADRP